MTRRRVGGAQQAVAALGPAPGLIHYLDWGLQYASAEYMARMTGIETRPNISAAGCAYDKAKAENLFKMLNREEVYLCQYQNFEEALRDIGGFLDDVYNIKRLHFRHGYRPSA